LLKGAHAESREPDFAKLKKIAKPGQRELKPAVERLAKLLESSGEVAEVQLDIVQGRATDVWNLSLERKTATTSNKPARHPDVHIIVSRTTWQEIAEGDRSPIDAFLSGKLRVRGDTDLAKRLFKRVADRGLTDFPLRGA
jgi:putative sterol carrier protein